MGGSPEAAISVRNTDRPQETVRQERQRNASPDNTQETIEGELRQLETLQAFATFVVKDTDPETLGKQITLYLETQAHRLLLLIVLATQAEETSLCQSKGFSKKSIIRFET